MIAGLKPYPQTRDSGVAWLGDVPSHWRVERGVALVQPRFAKNVGLTEKQVLSLSYGRIIVKPVEKLRGLVPESFETYQHVFPNDIIVRATDLQNDKTSLRVAIARDRGIITSAYLRLTARDGVNPEYAYRLLHGYDLMKVLYGYGSGLRQNLEEADFKQMPMPIPSPEEQAVIVSFLDHADQRIRRSIAAKQKMIRLLEEQKGVIIHQAVTRGLNPDVPLKASGVGWLGSVPTHWQVKRLKWAMHLQRGYDLPADQRRAGDYPVVSSGGVIGTHNEARCLGPGVAMGRYGSTNSVFFVNTDFWPHNTSLFVTDFYGNSPRWAYYVLRSIPKDEHAGKSAVPGVDRKDLFDIVIAVPPQEDQSKLADQIDEAVGNFDRCIATARQEVDLLNEYRAKLVADIVTGKLDVREAVAKPGDAGCEIDEPIHGKNIEPEDEEFDETGAEEEFA